MLAMEPGVNGAGKWKAQLLLEEDGFVMPVNEGGMPSVWTHSASPDSKRWAEGAEMKDIVRRWGEINMYRAYLVGFAAFVSGFAGQWDN